MIRIVLKHDDKVTTDDLVDFEQKIKKEKACDEFTVITH